jgi:hypothetical protein
MRDLVKMPAFRDAPFVASCLCVSPIFERSGEGMGRVYFTRRHKGES